ncbi:MAG: hypothetical protein JW703_05410 [Candidatus Diapherotrites archaeon]|nr:hypothetical protein [Candidatus Diapherotrites archaeon]
MDSADSLIERISNGSGKTSKDVASLIEAKKEKFSGLLTDAGAAFMVAKELGVSLEEKELKQESTELTKISKLSEGQMGVNLEVEVEHVFSPKKFEKNGKKGILCNCLVKDASGEIRVTLWHEDVKKFFEQGIQRGDKISLTNCAVSKFNEKLQLSVFGGGKIELTENAKQNDKKKKIKELTDNLIDVDVLAKITRVFPEREFNTGERQGKVLSFIAMDETGSIRCSAWNELTEAVQRIPLNSTVLIEGAYTKKGLNETELHLGWQSRVLFHPKKNTEFEKIDELNKIERKKLNELNDAELFEARTTIVDLIKGKMSYLACGKCGKKAESTEKGFQCDNCGIIESAKPRAITSILVDDGFACLRCSLFGIQAEQLLKTKASELNELTEEQLNEFIEKKKKELTGKEILLQAKARVSEANETELTCISFSKPETKKEIEKKIKEMKK